jgi:acyl-CoA synthetase (AMP-forming)/AMP-acid ligase II
MGLLSLSTRARWKSLLRANALRLGGDERPAIVYLETDKAPEVVTRLDFRSNVIKYGVSLQALGVRAGDLVVMAFTQSLDSIYAFWGALSIGAVPSMFPTLTPKLDPQIYLNNLAELVRLSGVRAVLTTDTFAPTLKARVACAVYSTQDLLPHFDVTLGLYQAKEDSVAFLQHSSGTTGLQKGVALSHRAVLNQLASYSDALQLDESDVVVSWLPLYHDMGLIAGFMLPLVQGIPLVLMSPFDWVSHPAMLLRAIHDYEGTLCWLPNFAYNHMARRIRQRDSEGLSLATMKAFINCSEPVHAESHALFLERFAGNDLKPSMLAVSYAMAENTFAVTQTPMRANPTHDVIDRVALQERLYAEPIAPSAATATVQVSCGKPIAGTQVKVVDADGKPLPERHVGEVLVRSDCMLTGYYKRSDLQPFDADGWYHSGDKGYIVGEDVYIIGRSKDLIINAGKNVYPQDIEAIVNGVEGVHAGRAVVFGVWDEREGTELVAVVAEVDTDDEAERKRIAQAIRQTVVQQSEVSVSFVALVGAGWLIKTSSGKIARSANREKWLRETQG